MRSRLGVKHRLPRLRASGLEHIRQKIEKGHAQEIVAARDVLRRGVQLALECPLVGVDLLVSGLSGREWCIGRGG